ncbi:SNF2 helicase associated domain-containing protein [Alkalibacillus sp. S2W]|uniref:DEAD/DEAH box helicase n=1 Tax=Alkalibacillus sp. S2W TaxID=3386553 RepID=UPI00398CC27A
MLSISEIQKEIPSHIYSRGLNYYHQGNIIHFKHNPKENTYHAWVSGSKIYQVRAAIENSTVNCSCNCPAFEDNPPCKHVAAVLIKMAKDTNAKEESHESDYEQFLRQREQRANQKRDYSSELIQALSNRPTTNKHQRETLKVEFTIRHFRQLRFDDKLSIEMKVGTNRLYVVKSMRKFLESLDRGEEHEFTPNFQYDPSEHVFSEEDQRVIDLLLQLYRNDVFYDGHFQTPPNSKGITVTPVLAKPLIEALSYCVCRLEDPHQSYQDIHWHNDELPFQYEIYQDENQYLFGFDNFKHITIYNEYDLVKYDNYFYPVDQQKMRTLSDIEQILARQTEPAISVSNQQIDSFMSEVYPQLEEVGEVTLTEEVSEKMIQPPLHATMHLDFSEDRLTANLKYQYDDHTFDPLTNEGPGETEQILIRDTAKEQEIMNMIEQSAFKFNGQTLYLDDDHDIFSFLYDQLPLFQDDINIYSTQPVKNILKDDLQTPTVQVDLDSGENLLDVQFDFGDIQPDDIRQMIQSVQEKKRFYRLPDGAFVPLDDDHLSQVSSIVNELNLSTDDLEKESVQLPAYRGLQIDEIADGLKTQYNKAFEQLIQDIKQPEMFEAEVPTTIQADLRDYQRFGFQWMKSLSRYHFGGILADDMGLGKTLQSITFLVSEQDDRAADDRGKPALIVAPASLVYNWQAEFEKFAPHMSVAIAHGAASDREKVLKESNHYDVIVTSYPSVRQDEALYRDLTFSTMILDEAQAIKNHLTKQAKAIRTIRSQRRFALSGTPIENSLDELWSIFDVLLPGLFPAKKAFRQLPEKQIARMSRPFILRRLKEDVLTELPDKIETVQHSELTTKQKQLYLGYLEQIQSEAANVLSTEEFQKNRMKILAGLTRLRQLCCHPSLFIEDYDGESGKLNQLLEMVETARASNQRLLIFSQFSSMLQIIQTKLDDMGVDAFYLDGQTHSKDRIDMANRFNEGEKDIFLISLKAGGTGLNLTGADTVILYDLWWNPAVEEQATGRAHRMGQQNVVQVFRLVTKGTIEEKIHQLQQRKRELIENVIQPGETTFQNLTENDIRELLNV